MDFRDTGQAAGTDIMSDVLEAELVVENGASEAPAKKPAPSKDEGEKAATNNDVAYEKAESDSKSVDVRRFSIVTDESRDALLTEFGKDTLQDRYLLPGENYQDLFARVASAYADD
jgi:ribonucleoside-diphosphate reductase alpha chain